MSRLARPKANSTVSRGMPRKAIRFIVSRLEEHPSAPSTQVVQETMKTPTSATRRQPQASVKRVRTSTPRDASGPV
jgi:hypothetical protein